MKTFVAALWLLLVSPVDLGGNAEVIELSPDTYMISKTDRAGIFGGGLSKLKGEVIKQANAFAAPGQKHHMRSTLVGVIDPSP